jgi:hypothetical protein
MAAWSSESASTLRLLFFVRQHGSHLESPVTRPDACRKSLAVQALHAAGTEVWLDVVYNHTAEGDTSGPTYSYRGVDNSSATTCSRRTGDTTSMIPVAATRCAPAIPARAS